MRTLYPIIYPQNKLLKILFNYIGWVVLWDITLHFNYLWIVERYFDAPKAYYTCGLIAVSMFLAIFMMKGDNDDS